MKMVSIRLSDGRFLNLKTVEDLMQIMVGLGRWQENINEEEMLAFVNELFERIRIRREEL